MCVCALFVFDENLHCHQIITNNIKFQFVFKSNLTLNSLILI